MSWLDILDVSSVQGRIDWARVAAADVAPGVARRWRAAICKLSEGETFRDSRRAENLDGARAAGLLTGGYAFIHPTKDPRRQVENAWAAVGDQLTAFPLALDVEAADASLTPAQLVDQIRRARDVVVEYFGRLPLVYSYPDFWARRVHAAAVGAPELADMPLWWASYGAGRPWYPSNAQLPNIPEPWRSAGKSIAIWQYSGNTVKTPGAWNGHVDGITGDVDRNVFVGSEEDFLHGLCASPRPEQLERPAPVLWARPEVTRS